MKRFLVWLLLGLMPWLSLQTQAGIYTPQHQLEHQLIHVSHVAHHHDNNGEIHYDLSQESTQHLIEYDACAHQLSLIPEFVLVRLAPCHGQIYAQSLADRLPSPFPDSLQKPPKHNA